MVLVTSPVGWVVAGLVAAILIEGRFGGKYHRVQRLRLGVGFVLMSLWCLQGSAYFHYFFDHDFNLFARRQTVWDVVFTNPFETSRVLYGAIFFFPMGVALMAFVTHGRGARGHYLGLLNRMTPVLFLVLGFSRLGCFANGCCYGVRSDMFGIALPVGSVAAREHWAKGLLPVPEAASLPVVPTQLLSSVALFGLAWYAYGALKRGGAHLLPRFVAFYAVFRFLIEFIRDDAERRYWFGVSASQWISLVVLLGVAVHILRLKRQGRWRPLDTVT